MHLPPPHPYSRTKTPAAGGEPSWFGEWLSVGDLVCLQTLNWITELTERERVSECVGWGP